MKVSSSRPTWATYQEPVSKPRAERAVLSHRMPSRFLEPETRVEREDPSFTTGPRGILMAVSLQEDCWG